MFAFLLAFLEEKLNNCEQREIHHFMKKIKLLVQWDIISHMNWNNNIIYSIDCYNIYV